MVNIGQINELKVVRSVDFGVYLDGLEFGEILLPKKYIDNNIKIGGFAKVFIYFDSEDRIIATTKMPYMMVGEVALLKVVAVNRFGAFVDWGLEKDLLVPLNQQKQRMRKGKHYLIYVYVESKTNLIAGSGKVHKFIDNVSHELKKDDSVNLFIYGQTELGYQAIINKSFLGVLYQNEVFQDLRIGQEIKGFIKKIRDDGKIDLSLYESGYKKVDSLEEKIINKLKENDGYIALNDKSSPEMIYDFFGISKKSYKLAIGALYKQRLIKIETKGIRLLFLNRNNPYSI